MKLDFIKNIGDNPRNKRKIALYSFLMIVILTLIFSEYGVYKRLSLMSQYSDLHFEMHNLKHETDSLKREMKTLKTNIREIERIAREEYGLVKKGENIIFFQSKK